MAVKKKIYYCESCKSWRGAKAICPECGMECIERDLPKARGGYYFIEGVDIPLVRVTGVLGDVLAKPALRYWAAKEAATAALADPTMSVQQAANAMYTKRDAAGLTGTDAHKAIELLSKGGKVSQLKLDMPQVKAYQDFCKEVPHEIMQSELTVHSVKYGYAGTLDAIIKMDDGRICLIDYKTSKGVYPETALQMSAYKQAVEEMGIPVKIDGLAVVHLKKDGTFSFIKMAECFDVFESVLRIYQWQQLTK